MLQNTYKEREETPKKRKNFFPAFSIDKRFQIAVGLLLQGLTLFMFAAFVGHLVHGQADQGVIEEARELGIKVAGAEIRNWLGLAGAMCSYYLMFRWLGIGAFLLLPIGYLAGHRLVYGKALAGISLYKTTLVAIFSLLWLNIALGYADLLWPEKEMLEGLVGDVGFELVILCHSLLGWGTLILLLTTLLIALVYGFNITTLPQLAAPWALFGRRPTAGFPDDATATAPYEEEHDSSLLEDLPFIDGQAVPLEVTNRPEEILTPSAEAAPPFTVTQPTPEKEAVAPQENYDPKLDLSAYQYPTITVANVVIRIMGRGSAEHNKWYP